MYTHKKTFIFSLFLTFLISTSVGIKLLQHHPFTLSVASTIVSNMMKQAFNCNFVTEVESVNFFAWSITCTNVRVKPNKTSNNQGWHWFARKLKFSFSPIDFLLTKKFMLVLHLEKTYGYSLISDKGFPLSIHLNDIFFGKKFKVPIVLKTLKMDNIKLDLHNEKYQLDGTICWSGVSKKIKDKLKSILCISQGSIKHHDLVYAKNFRGTIYANISQSEPSTMFLDAYTKLLHNKKRCFVRGDLIDQQATLKFWNQDKQLDFTAHYKNGIISTSGKADTFFFKNLFPQLPFNEKIKASLRSTIKDGASHGKIKSDILPLKGIWSFEKGTFNFTFKNHRDITTHFFPTWLVEKNKLHTTGSYDANKKSLSFSIPLHHKLSDKAYEVAGTLTNTDKKFSGHGICGSGKWNIAGSIFPHFSIKEFLIKTKNAMPIFSLSCTKDRAYHFKNTIYYQDLKSLLPDQIKNYLDGNAVLEIAGTCSPHKVKAHIKLKKGMIVFGQLHNILNDLEGKIEIDLITRIITIPYLKATFNEGCVTITHASIRLSERGKPLFIYAPLTFNKCLINFEKNFAICSGNLIATFNNPHTNLVGNLSLEKTFFYKIPTPITNTALFTKPITATIKIETKDGIHVHTPGLQTQLHASVKMLYNQGAFYLDGWAKVSHGSIILPYSRLNIISGTLYFASEQQFDPLLELTARTQMSHHTITVHVTGSIKNPIIRLSSIPSLTEEKIGALLLTGSPKASLNAIAPTLIVEFIKKQIIEHSTPLMQRKNLQSLLKPLKYIKFAPSFTDESGTSGLYGGIELDLGKRLQAKVQKNLNLQEDTEFEINYHVSDELNVQAFKNEQGDIGGQLQMHLKL